MENICSICNVPISAQNTATHVNGKKHLKNLEQLQRTEWKERCGIFVTGFPESVNENEIMRYFLNFGQTSAHFFDKSKKFLIIEYSSPQPVDTLLGRNHFFQGRKLLVKRRVIKNRIEERQQADAKIEVPLLDCNSINSKLQNLTVDFDEQVSVFLSLIKLTCKEPEEKYNLLQSDLYKSLKEMFPNCTLHRFGSTITGLGFESSDVDIYCNINETDTIPQDKLVMKVRNLFYRDKNRAKFAKVFSMPQARTPIVKFVHIPTRICCDLNFRNLLGVYNSKFIAYYLSLDNNLKTLMLIIKFWARMHGYSSGNAKFSNYTLTMMLIFFLQQEPIGLPSVYSLQSTIREDELEDNWNPYFNEAIVDTRKIKAIDLKDLLYSFFEFYAVFDFGLYVISPFLGRPILKMLFLEPESLPKEFCLYKRNVQEKEIYHLKVDRSCCVQDPFELNNNIAAGVQEKILKMFCLSCQMATFTIQNNMKKNTLWNLFNEKPTFPNFVSFSSSEISISLPRQTKYISNFIETKDIDENRIRQAWFNFYKDFLMIVLKEVLKLEVEIVENDCTSKISKKEGQTDVHNDNIVACINLRCKSKWNMLDSRRSAKYTCTENQNALDKEIAISHYISKVLNQKSSKDIVDFEITLKCKANPTELVLTMRKFYSNHSYFQRLIEFMNRTITATAVKYLTDLEKPMEYSEKQNMLNKNV